MIYTLLYSLLLWPSHAQTPAPTAMPSTMVKTAPHPPKIKKRSKRKTAPPPQAAESPPTSESTEETTATGDFFGIPFPGVEPDVDFDDKATAGQKNRPESKDGPFFGVTLGTGWTQDYPASQDGRMRFLAIPAYKSKHFSIDRQDGVKGDLLERERFQFSVSFMFLFPTDTKDMPARAGMPDLGWTLQLGPEVRVELFHNHFHTMYLRLPLRFVANTDFRHHFDYLDYNFAPGFRNVFDLGKWGELITRLEADIAAEKYNDLFYQVDTQYVTPARPYYDARAGLTQYIAGAQYSYYDFVPWTLFIGANFYWFNDARNRASPLFFREQNYSVFGGVVRYF